jgi:nucleotide-binding universal stress UspA family protein
MITLKRILIPTDFGDAAETALEYGRALARTFGATLTVVHVTEDVMAASFGIDGYVGTYPGLQQSVDDNARKQLDALLSEQDRADLGGRTVLLTSRSPAFAIVNYARDMSADAIVMGTHGRGTMAHLLMGSVAERVVRTAPCPVLTVKHPEHEFVLPDALVAVSRA